MWDKTEAKSFDVILDCELGLVLLIAEGLSVFVFPAGTKEDEYMIGGAIAGMAYLAELDAKNSKMT